MGMVTDVFWECPGCGSRERAQAYGEGRDPEEFPVTAVPSSRGLKWNPPCTQCGKFQLMMSEVYVQCVPVAVDPAAGGKRG